MPTNAQQDAIAALCLYAAFSDGQPDETERARLKVVMESLSASGDLSPDVYQRVIFKKTTIQAEAAALDTPQLKQFAYEMAVSICDADGASSPGEQQFLKELAQTLGLPAEEAKATVERVDLLATDSLATEAPAITALATTGAVGATASTSAAAGPGRSAQDAEIDRSILNYSILNGALELLPQGLATAAIIPLQMKMVYAIGKRYGFTLDRGHIKDLLATAGVGMTSQVIESTARKLVGGLLQNFGSKLIGKSAAKALSGISTRATGAAFSFASTYALGQVARQYYSGGRTMSAIDLRQIFTQQTQQAQSLYERYRPQVEAQSKTISPTQIMSMVRSG